MGFNTKEFQKTEFVARTEKVRVADLSAWFDEGEEPVFVVRGLTFEELCKAESMADNSKAMLNLMASIQQRDGIAIGEGIKDAFGVGKETPANMIKRINHLVIASIDPVIDEELAVKIASTFPIEFTAVTNKITELTGKGFVPGKRKGCTDNKM